MRTLPDYLRRGMRLVIVGCNPGEQSARVGHYYAGRNNVFWKLLYESGIVGEELTHNEDRRLIEFGVGLTDLVKRPTRGEEELSREEFAEGRVVLSQKFEQFAPRVVAFNGKNVYEKFNQRPCTLGLQKGHIYGARVFVLPSSSAKNATAGGVKLRYFRQLARFLEKMEKEPESRSSARAVND
jgi:mismatch-specific thymine-DNA glycosylase